MYICVSIITVVWSCRWLYKMKEQVFTSHHLDVATISSTWQLNLVWPNSGGSSALNDRPLVWCHYSPCGLPQEKLIWVSIIHFPLPDWKKKKLPQSDLEMRWTGVIWEDRWVNHFCMCTIVKYGQWLCHNNMGFGIAFQK